MKPRREGDLSLENKAFLAAMHKFQDFLRMQKGAYTDACAAYRSNHREISTQVSKVLKGARRKLDSKGVPSIVHTSVKDPTAPDVVVQTTRLSKEFLEANSRNGSNEQQICQAIVIFVFTYWDYVTRHELALSLDVEKNDILLPIAGDLRLLRHAIIHDGGVLRSAAHKRLEVLGEYFRPDHIVLFPHDRMHHIFRLLDRGIAKLTMEKLGIPAPPGGIDSVDQIAIQRPTLPKGQG